MSSAVAWQDGEAAVLRELEHDARECDDTEWAECTDCCGCGVVYFPSGEQRCDVCDGVGLVEA